MAEDPDDPGRTPVPRLKRANTEPGDRAIRPVVTVLNAVLEPLTRRDWRGQDRLPERGGVVVVANHISNVDPLALGQFLAYSGRWPRFMAKQSLFSLPLVGRLLRGAGQIPVDRASGRARSSLAAATSALAQGRAVVVYPEGTITRDPDLWPMRGRTGAARLALASGCPVVPVGQWGAEQIMYGPRVGVPHLFGRPTLRLLVGPPVDLDDLRAQPVTAATLREATDRIMAAITALVAELRGGTPPAVPFDPRQPDVEAGSGP